MRSSILATCLLTIFVANCKTNSESRVVPKKLGLNDCDPQSNPNCNANSEGDFVPETQNPVTAENDPNKGSGKNTGKTIPPSQNNPTQGKLGPQPTPQNPQDPIIDPVVSLPKCSATNIQIVKVNGQCPAQWAAFAADDNTGNVLACCPLPFSDVLTADAPQNRGTQCGENEVAVGAASPGGLSCAKINTAKYKLAPAVKSCYVGSGASGGSGTSKCQSPSVVAKAMITTFGSDACLGVPFGSLVTKRSSKYCRDVTTSVLLDVATGTPIPMF